MIEVAAHPAVLKRFQMPALVAGIIGLSLCALGCFLNPRQFFLSYLYAYMFWIGLSLGCLAILMLQHLTGGQWGLVIRRPLESGTRVLPLMAILFIPLGLGLRYLYVWTTHPPAGEHGPSILQAHWLTPSAFLLRGVIYFLIWLGLTAMLNRWSIQQDQTGDPRLLRRFKMISGPGLILYGLTVTFASIDWVMSMDPHWYSTMFGMLFIIGQALSAMAFMIVITVILSRSTPLNTIIIPARLHDLGNLLFAFVMLWAYLSFSQYLITWAGNLAEEAPYYIYRTHGGWQWVALALIVLHFFIPFVLLLSRWTKKATTALATIAVGIMVMRFVDLFWIITPTYAQGHPESYPPHEYTFASTLHWLDFAAPIGIGGLWLAWYLRQLQRRPLMPLNDPRLEEVSSAHV